MPSIDTTPLPADPQDDDADEPTGESLDGLVEAVIEVDGPPARLEDFADLGVSGAIVSALSAVGITHPFPIQAMTLPIALTGNDIIGQAKTGTGKTLGFGIPALQRVTGPADPGFDGLEFPGRPQALVVVPTRELAVQVAGDLDTAARNLSARVLTVYGGRAYEPQIDALRRGVEIVVGTPGRLLDLAQQGHLKLSSARIVVLDEADEMLDLGFLPDVERLLSMTPAGRQTMLFSATMPGAVVALARRYMTQPTHIRAADPEDTGATVKAVKQFAYRAHAMDKTEMLSRILQAQGRGLTMIFARTKRTVAKVADDLTDRGFAVGAIHGDLGQGAREQALRAFRNGKVDVLVATDVAARGIDVDDVTHVINYQCPEDEKTYLHRIGRTARAGNKGTAVTFVDWDEVTRWNMISTALDLAMPDPPETYSSSEHLFSDLDIPEKTRGLLPRGSRTRAGLGAEVVEDLGETGGRARGAGRRGAPAGRSGGRGERTERPPRDHDRSRDDHARDGHAGDAAAPGELPEGDAVEGAEAGERRPRRVRQRRRTRGGKPLDREADGTPGDDGALADGALADGAPADGAPVDGASADRDTADRAPAGRAAGSRSGADGEDAADATDPSDAPRRRRRRRGGRGSGAAAGVSEGPEDGSGDSPSEPVSDAGAAG